MNENLAPRNIWQHTMCLQFVNNIIQIQIHITLLHYNVLHCQTEFDPSYDNPQ